MDKRILWWLMLLWLVSCTSSEIKIGLRPYNEFSSSLTDTLVKSLQNTYNATVIILPERQLPVKAFVEIKTPRYRADSLLVDLKVSMPENLDYILGLTHADISTTKRDKTGKILKPVSKYTDWGVFGLGYRPGPSSVVSTYRLQSPDYAVFISRFKKVCIHEVGHNLGLKHCPTPGCVMMDAVEKIQTVDSAGYELCEKCLRIIHRPSIFGKINY